MGSAAAGALITAALGTPIIGFLLSPIVAGREPVVERLVGYVGGLPEGVPVRFVVSFPQNAWRVPEEKHTVYVVRSGDSFRVFSNVCSHMQCPVHWEEDIHQFLCPCHGGLYSLEGRNLGGPPPKPLPEYVHRIDSQQMLYVQNRLTESI